MDALDRRILRVVQRDCSLSAAQLAARCGTTESTAQRRLKRLRHNGVIRSEVAIVDGPKVGRGLLLFLNVRLSGEDAAHAREFVDRISRHPDVMQLYFVTGDADYLIALSVATMADYDKFLQEHLVADARVIWSGTNVVIRPLKMTLEIPIDEPARP